MSRWLNVVHTSHIMSQLTMRTSLQCERDDLTLNTSHVLPACWLLTVLPVVRVGWMYRTEQTEVAKCTTTSTHQSIGLVLYVWQVFITMCCHVLGASWWRWPNVLLMVHINQQSKHCTCIQVCVCIIQFNDVLGVSWWQWLSVLLTVHINQQSECCLYVLYNSLWGVSWWRWTNVLLMRYNSPKRLLNIKIPLQSVTWHQCLIGASLSEPHTGQTASLVIYLSIVRHSVNKCPRVLIHWTSSILQCVINSVKCHYVQIIETTSILHVQWVWRACALHVVAIQLTTRHRLVLVHWVG